MSSAGTRERKLPCPIDVPGYSYRNWTTGKSLGHGSSSTVVLANGTQLTESTSNPIDRKTGQYHSGSSFYTSKIEYSFSAGSVSNAVQAASGEDTYYSGPVLGVFPTSTERSSVGWANPNMKYGDHNDSKLSSDGTTAISLCSPTNSASDLGLALAEAHREGLPSLPGVKAWKGRTELLRAAGDEFLNAEFGWLPLVSDVKKVGSAARHYRDLLKNYHSNEGTNIHRSFHFPSQYEVSTIQSGREWPLLIGVTNGFTGINGAEPPQRTVSLVRETKRWFEGCFTYALPSSSDSWKRMLGIGSDADQLFGIALTPDILWELTPWSWAVDWFSNAGQVINNVTNFGLAGLVLRYGYMMEESIESVTAEVGSCKFRTRLDTAYKNETTKYGNTDSSPCSMTISVVTKRRRPASPFGFSIGWEGLSPTQLAITAALGITRLL